MHSYGADGEKTMQNMNQNFNREVIDRTIEGMRQRFIERGLSEDILERLKANWLKNLQQRIAQNKEEALKRHYAYLERQSEVNKEHVEVLAQ